MKFQLTKPLVFAAVVLGALAAAPLAGAHVTVHPNALPAGGFAEIALRVPNEQEQANTTKVEVQFPPGFVEASYEPVPGWTTEVTHRKLAAPVEMEGHTLTEEVNTITWSGGKIAPGQFLNFPLSVAIPEHATGALTFKVIQTYDNGDVSRWIGAADAEEPAPRVLVLAAGSAGADYPGGTPTSPDAATTSATSTTSEEATSSTDDDDDSDTMTTIAIVLGAAGLAAGLAGLGFALANRRPKTA